MIFKIKYQRTKDAADPYSNFTRSIFAERDSVPSREMIKDLVKQISNSDFDEATIEIEQLFDCDPESFDSMGGLHKFQKN